MVQRKIIRRSEEAELFDSVQRILRFDMRNIGYNANDVERRVIELNSRIFHNSSSMYNQDARTINGRRITVSREDIDKFLNFQNMI